MGLAPFDTIPIKLTSAYGCRIFAAPAAAPVLTKPFVKSSTLESKKHSFSADSNWGKLNCGGIESPTFLVLPNLKSQVVLQLLAFCQREMG